MAILLDTSRYPRSFLCIAIALLGLAGLAGNWLHLDIFFNVDHLFGSIAVLVATALFGPLAGLASALIAHSYTVAIWGHPYAYLVFCAEALIVGFLMKRGVATPINADIVFWLVCGIPLEFAQYFYMLDMSAGHALLLVSKQAVNGITNALLATVLLLAIKAVLYRKTGYENFMVSIRTLIYTACISVVLLSGVFVAIVDIKKTIGLLERQAISRCVNGTEVSVRLVQQHLRHCNDILARLGSSGESGQDLKKRLVLQHNTLSEFTELGLFDKAGAAVALSRKDNEAAHILAANQSTLTWTKPPMPNQGFTNPTVGSVMVHPHQLHQSILLLSQPSFKDAVYQGQAVAVVATDHIHNLLTPLFVNTDRSYTLLDSNRRVIASSRHDLSAMDLVPEPERFKYLSDSVRQVTPSGLLRSSSSSRWKKASLQSEMPVLDNTGWTMQVEFNYAPIVRSFEQLLQSRIYFLAALIAVSVLLAEFLSRLFTLPFVQFRQFAHEFSSLDQMKKPYESPASYGLKELKQLSGLFDSLVQRIQSLFGEQQQLNSRLEKIVDERTSQLRMLGDNLPKGVMFQVWKNPNGRREFVFISQGLEAIFGVSEADALRDFDLLLGLVAEKDRVRLLHDIDRSAETLTPIDNIYQAHKRDGSDIWVRLLCAPRIQEDSSIIWDGVLFDDSERGRYEATLLDAHKSVEDATVSRTMFLATMSHEIRTPLSAMLGTLELLGATRLTDEQQKYLDDCRFASDGLMQIINDILDYSKIEAGKLSLSTAPFEPEHLFSQMAQMFRPIAERKNIRLLSRIENSAQAGYLIGDQYRIRQIIANLLSNAIKFTKQGQVELVISVEQGRTSLPGQVDLVMQVIDTGIGIPVEKQSEIFNRFEQVDDITVRSQTGTGLGLAICVKLAELMGSRIELTSTPGKGSCFRLDLNLAIGEAPDLPLQPIHKAQNASYKVLLVDDDEMNRMVVQVLLERDGHTVLTAECGKQALQLLKSHQVDIILSDISMPEMSGKELLAIIRSGNSSAAPDIPVIALTALAMPEDQQQLMEAGFTAYTTKPFNFKQLLVSIQHCCNSQPDQDLTT